MMVNEHGYVMAIEKLLGIEVPLRAQYIRVHVRRNHAPAEPPDVARRACAGRRRDGRVPVRIPRTRRPDGLATKRCPARVCMRLTTVRAASIAICLTRCRSTRRRRSAMRRRCRATEREPQGSLLDFIDDFIKRFPNYVDEYETLLTDNRIWKQRLVGIGVVVAGAREGNGLYRRDAARLGHRMGSAQEAAVRSLRPAGFRHSGRRQRRLLRPLSGARRGDAPVQRESSSSASNGCATIRAR